MAPPCPLGSHHPSSPALGVPFSILTPCLMPCPRPDAVLTSLTCTRAYTVCLITMSVSGHWGAMGLHPDRQVSAFPGEWEGGVGEQDIGAHISALPPTSRSCTPPSLPPSTMPASRTHGVLGPAKDKTWGCILGLDSAAPTHSRPDLAPTQCQSPALGRSSRVQPASLPHLLRPLRGQQCGDSAAIATSQKGAGRAGSVVFGFGSPCCGPQESSGFGS